MTLDRTVAEERLLALKQIWSSCNWCSLHENRASIVFGDGSLTPRIVVVSEAPSRRDSSLGIPMTEENGWELLRIFSWANSREDVKAAVRDLKEVGLRMGNPTGVGAALRTEFNAAKNKVRKLLLEELHLLTVVMCPAIKSSTDPSRPSEPREPDSKEVAKCGARLKEQIYVLDPRIIITVGNSALQSLTDRPKDTVAKHHGRITVVDIPGRLGPVPYPVVPIHSYEYIKREDPTRERGKLSEQTYKIIAKVYQTAYGIETLSRSLRPLIHNQEQDRWE